MTDHVTRIGIKDIQDLVAQMTLEEKAALCDGKDFWHLKSIERLGIPSIMVCDGPHGLRKQNPNGKKVGIYNSVPAVCFPTAVTSACSWDKDLLRTMGEALGEECLQEQVAVLLGPGVNMKRSPLCGRNFEYFSEDPLLAGELGAAFIQGVQSKGVGTSLKHYAVNNQETRRMTVDAVVDERALREIYLTAFEIAVKKSKPWTVMCAYNRLNGEYCAEHEQLQISILRDEWGYDGVVVSDWGAVNDRAKGLKNGNDLEMPSSYGVGRDRILAAVKNGDLDEAVLDQRVTQLLKLIFKGLAGMRPDFTYDEATHHALAARIAGESMVLLKNTDNLLPLKDGASVAVIGELAEKPRYQGAGSSLINPTRLDNALDCLKARGINAVYAPGYRVTTGVPDEDLIAEAVQAAKEAETVILFVGLTDEFESEGFDRDSMALPEAHNALVKAVCAVNPRVAVVLSGGAPVELPWIDDIGALLNAYLGGQAGADGIADILTGRVNPSGKLAETYPHCNGCTPAKNNFPGNTATVEYRESLYIGYRYYDKVNKPVQFPFGYGLSYTRFEYADIALSDDYMLDDETLTVRFTIKNTGDTPGAEIAQVYVADKESTAFRPEKELKGFEKVFLQPGEEKEVCVTLDKRAFAYYNTAIGDWHVESGAFDILVGASSADIRLSATVKLASSLPDAPIPDIRETAPSYYTGDVVSVPDSEFVALLGRPIPPSQRDNAKPLDITDNLENSAHTKWGGRLCRLVTRLVKRFAGSSAGMMTAIALQTPFRNFVCMSGGLFTLRMADGLLRILNGDKPCKGLGMVLGGVPRALFKFKKFLKTI